MNSILVSGNVANGKNQKEARIFNKGKATIVSSIAVDFGKPNQQGKQRSEFIPVKAFINTDKQKAYLQKLLTTGHSTEVTGEIKKDHYQDKNNLWHSNTYILASHLRTVTGNFNTNSALLSGNLVAGARFTPLTTKHGKVVLVSGTVACSDNYGKITFIPVQIWISNSKVLDYYKKNAQKGTAIEILNGRYYVNKYQDKNKVYQDNSGVTANSINVALGYTKNGKQSK